MKDINVSVNGRNRSVKIDDPEMPLLYLLRNELDLKGTHFGCGLGQCGACTVQLDGTAVRSCLLPSASVKGRITTVEGVVADPQNQRLIQAFEELQASQCGYCTSGMVVAASALLKRNAKPSRLQIVEALDGNLCRCGTHLRYVAAVQKASGQEQGGKA